MPIIETIDSRDNTLYQDIQYNGINNNNHDNIYINNTVLSMIDKAGIEFKIDNTGTITNKDILAKTKKHISIWPTMIVVEANTTITQEAISTKSLSQLITNKIKHLDDKYNNNNNRLYMPGIKKTKENLQYIKSILPTIIIMEPNEWKITEEGRIDFILSGTEGLQDIVSLFDINLDNFELRTLSLINLNTEAVFYPHLDNLDVVLDHIALSTSKMYNIKLKRHIIFRFKGANLVITSPLYSAKTTCDNFNDPSGDCIIREKDTTKNKIRKIRNDDDKNRSYCLDDYKTLYHNSIIKINDIIYPYIPGKYCNPMGENHKEKVLIMLMKGYIPGYSYMNIDDNNNNNNKSTNGTLNIEWAHSADKISEELKLKNLHYFISYITIYNINDKQNNEKNKKAKDNQRYVEKNIHNLVEIIKNVKNVDYSPSILKVDTVALFNSITEATKVITQSPENKYNNIKADIKIDGNLLSSSLINGISRISGNPIFCGGMLVADTADQISLKPIFEKSFPELYYDYIPIKELVIYLVDFPQSIRSEHWSCKGRYSHITTLIYNILFKDICDETEKVLTKMNLLVTEVSNKLFGISNNCVFTDRIWNLSHWDFPISVIVSLYGLLVEQINVEHDLWTVTHMIILEKLIMRVFDSLFEIGVWVSSQVRAFMAWVVEDVLLPLLCNKTIVIKYKKALDNIIKLSFQWIAVDSAANNNGLCKCFPNRNTWFYIEPKRKMVEYTYSPIPRFILSDSSFISEVPISSKSVHNLIKNWPPIKGVGEKLFAIRNMTTQWRQPLKCSFIINCLNGLKIDIKRTPQNDNDNYDDNNCFDADMSTKYNYKPPQALLQPDAQMLPLGHMRDHNLLESSLSVLWKSKKKKTKDKLGKTIIKILKQSDMFLDDTFDNGYLDNDNIINDVNFSNYSLMRIINKKRENHRYILTNIMQLPLNIIEEVASITSGSISFNDTENDGFSWLFDYGLLFNIVKPDLPSNDNHVATTTSIGLDKIDKLLYLIENTIEENTYTVTNDINEYKNISPIISDDLNKTSIFQQKIKEQSDLKIKHSLLPFSFLEHIDHSRIVDIKNHNTTTISKINIDSTLLFIYGKLPYVLEDIILRILLTFEPKEVEFIRKLAISVSRIIADSLLITLDPRNAINIKNTLKEPITMVRDSMGIISMYRKGQRRSEYYDGDNDNSKSLITEILSSSKVLSLISDKDTLQTYINSLHTYRPVSTIFSNEEKAIIEEENSPMLKNMRTRRGLEDTSQSWTHDNINQPYVVPTFEENGDRCALLADMPDNVNIFVPVIPSLFLLDVHTENIKEMVKENTKHITDKRKEEEDNIRKYRDEIFNKILEKWTTKNNDTVKNILDAADVDILTMMQNKQAIAIKNAKLLTSIPFCMDIDAYNLHLLIRNNDDIDYYLKVPNFWRIMNIEELLKFAIEMMLITLNELIKVGLSTAAQFLNIADIIKRLYKADKNIFL
uniref:Wsv289-like protein n=1 Tax=Trachysalambria curvirostris majanivirus TaxID=2984281 RepID=A0A9C7C000_9VIRU|nr:MAG: wsv289-like protein [Trachysalambria curvirostris majanivirus]